MSDGQDTFRMRKRDRKNLTTGIAHVHSSFNNTIITITDDQGNAIAWASSGSQRFRGSRKATPFAAQVAAEDCARKAAAHGMSTIEVVISGPGSGKDAAVRALQSSGFTVRSIRDVTPVPHNGCRGYRKRRV